MSWSDSDNDGPPGLYPISEEYFGEEFDRLIEPVSEGEQTDSSNNDTAVSLSGSETEVLERPYYSIGDILGTMVALILNASGPYPGIHCTHNRVATGSQFTEWRVTSSVLRIDFNAPRQHWHWRTSQRYNDQGPKTTVRVRS